MTEQELIEKKDSETMECVSGMIRYGYQEAIDEIQDLVDLYSKDNDEIPLDYLQDKLTQMKTNKCNINLEKLQKEIETYAKPKPTSK